MKEGFLWCPHCREPHSFATRFCPTTGQALDKKLHDGVAAPVAMHPLAGTLLADRYEIINRIGTGGMSDVFEARERRTGRLVAVKLVKDKDEQAAARLLRESEIIASLSHPNLCAIIDVGSSRDGRPYLVLERLEGETLATRLHGRRRLPVSIALPIFTQILAGLSCAHESGILHRDLKPSNIFLVHLPTKVPLVKLLDFGLATDMRTTRRVTKPGRVAGTPRYMAPEQLMGGKLTAQTDLFSLGLVFYEALVGDHPFLGRTADETTRRILVEREVELSRRRADLPFGLTAIVHAALSKERDGRPLSASHMLNALSMLPPPDDDEPPTDSVGYSIAPVSGSSL